MSSLREIEARIALLEQQLSLGSEDDAAALKDKDDDASKRESPPLLPIPPLPPSLLPGSSSSLSGATATEWCRTCKEPVPVAAMKAHKRSVAHQQAAALRAGETYAAVHHANYCRYCEARFADVAALMEHRKTPEHNKRRKRHDRASHCAQCNAQFTSPLQLREHLRGKAHKSRAPPQ